MGTFRVRLPSSGAIESDFERMPAPVRSFVRDGFDILARVPEKSFDDLRTAVIESVHSGSAIKEGDLPTRLGVSAEDTRVLLGSMSLIASMVSAREITADEFVISAVNVKLIGPQNKQAAHSFISAILRDRTALKRSIEQSSAASEVLPSLLDFEVTVDLRLAFEKNAVRDSIPVALVHIDTDAMSEELWFQANKRQLERLIKELEDAVQKMEQAEKWARRTA